MILFERRDDYGNWKKDNGVKKKEWFITIRAC